MKKYVFLTFAVAGIGGTQIFVRNKLLFLRRQGYQVTVITTEPGRYEDICVEELRPHFGFITPELIKNPYLYGRKSREDILSRLSHHIDPQNGDEITIESNFIAVTLWGELLARKLHARHCIFLIQEDYRLPFPKWLRFFAFKYRRGELAANTPHALSKLFKGFLDIPAGKNGALTAYCSNVVEACDSRFTPMIDGADFYIGSIGRLNKPFVLPMIGDVVEYAGRHPDKRFLLVLFGGSPESSDVDAVTEKCAASPNLHLVVTGPIFPVPKHLIEKMDVFISSAGAAATSADLGRPTIVIDAHDFEPIGVLHHTTEEMVHRDPALPHPSTGALLDEILVGKKYPPQASRLQDEPAVMERCFQEHMTYFGQADAELKYYPVWKVAPHPLRLFFLAVARQLCGSGRS